MLADGARYQMTDTTIETGAGRERRCRHSGRVRNAPVGDHYQTTGQTETVSGAGHRAVVGQMLCDFFEPAPDKPIEWLQEEDGLTESVEELPARITAGQVGQLVREETFLMLVGEIFDPFRTADLRPSNARGKGHCDGRRGAQSN
jgi:hypothetical protein